jgi:hypothetical protein
MYKFDKIIETKDVLNYLETRQILEQYKKAKLYLQLGLYLQVKF